MSVWQQAGSAFRNRRGDLFLIGGARLFLSALCLAAGFWVQQRTQPLQTETVITGWIHGADIFLLGSLILFAVVQMPLRVQTDWHIGSVTGALDESDLGFLRLSNPLWLWGRAFSAYALAALLRLLAWVPFFVLLTAAKCIWTSIAPDTESILPLLLVLHMLMLSAAALLLPLRMIAAETALPFCFLKNPHRSAAFVLTDALRRTRHHSFAILRTRLVCLPLLLIPPFNTIIFPRMLAAEMLRTQESGR